MEAGGKGENNNSGMTKSVAVADPEATKGKSDTEKKNKRKFIDVKDLIESEVSESKGCNKTNSRKANTLDKSDFIKCEEKSVKKKGRTSRKGNILYPLKRTKKRKALSSRPKQAVFLKNKRGQERRRFDPKKRKKALPKKRKRRFKKSGFDYSRISFPGGNNSSCDELCLDLRGRSNYLRFEEKTAEYNDSLGEMSEECDTEVQDLSHRTEAEPGVNFSEVYPCSSMGPVVEDMQGGDDLGGLQLITDTVSQVRENLNGRGCIFLLDERVGAITTKWQTVTMPWIIVRKDLTPFDVLRLASDCIEKPLKGKVLLVVSLGIRNVLCRMSPTMCKCRATRCESLLFKYIPEKTFVEPICRNLMEVKQRLIKKFGPNLGVCFTDILPVDLKKYNTFLYGSHEIEHFDEKQFRKFIDYDGKLDFILQMDNLKKRLHEEFSSAFGCQEHWILTPDDAVDYLSCGYYCTESLNNKLSAEAERLYLHYTEHLVKDNFVCTSSQGNEYSQTSAVCVTSYGAESSACRNPADSVVGDHPADMSHNLLAHSQEKNNKVLRKSTADNGSLLAELQDSIQHSYQDMASDSEFCGKRKKSEDGFYKMHSAYRHKNKSDGAHRVLPENKNILPFEQLHDRNNVSGRGNSVVSSSHFTESNRNLDRESYFDRSARFPKENIADYEREASPSFSEGSSSLCTDRSPGRHRSIKYRSPLRSESPFKSRYSVVSPFRYESPVRSECSLGRSPARTELPNFAVTKSPFRGEPHHHQFRETVPHSSRESSFRNEYLVVKSPRRDELSRRRSSYGHYSRQAGEKSAVSNRRSMTPVIDEFPYIYSSESNSRKRQTTKYVSPHVTEYSRKQMENKIITVSNRRSVTPVIDELPYMYSSSESKSRKRQTSKHVSPHVTESARRQMKNKIITADRQIIYSPKRSLSPFQFDGRSSKLQKHLQSYSFKRFSRVSTEFDDASSSLQDLTGSYRGRIWSPDSQARSPRYPTMNSPYYSGDTKGVMGYDKIRMQESSRKRDGSKCTGKSSVLSPHIHRRDWSPVTEERSGYSYRPVENLLLIDQLEGRNTNPQISKVLLRQEEKFDTPAYITPAQQGQWKSRESVKSNQLIENPKRSYLPPALQEKEKKLYRTTSPTDYTRRLHKNHSKTKVSSPRRSPQSSKKYSLKDEVLQRLREAHKMESEIYQKHPESFPIYEKEKHQFFAERGQQLSSSRKYSDADMTEWYSYWYIRLNMILNNRWEKTKRTCLEILDNTNLIAGTHRDLAIRDIIHEVNKKNMFS